MNIRRFAKSALFGLRNVGAFARDGQSVDERLRAYEFERINDPSGWHQQYYNAVAELVRSIKAHSIVEIGVAYGWQATNLLKQFPDLEYCGVDPYIGGYDENDPFSREVFRIFGSFTQQLAMNRLYTVVRSKLSAFGPRATLHRATSGAVAPRFANRSIDIVFVDGEHSYDGVMVDLNAWWSKVRPGGIICGDDYDWPAVKQAVNEFFSERNCKVRHKSASQRLWYVYQSAAFDEATANVATPNNEIVD